MRTTLLVGLVFAAGIAAALITPFAGAKAKVRIHLSPSPSGVRVEVSSTTSRPLVLLLDGRRISKSTGTVLGVTVPLRFVSLDSSRIVVRDGVSRAVLATQTFSGRYFLKPRAPRLQLVRTPLGPTTAHEAFLSWRSNGGRTSCAIDGRAAKACSSPLRLTELELGRHDVVITVFGHNSQSSVHAIWTVQKEAARYEALRQHAGSRGSATPTPTTSTATATPPTATPPTATTPTATTAAAPAATSTTSTTTQSATTAAPQPAASSAPASTLTPAQFESRATSGATIANAHVTGWVTITSPNVTVQNVDFDGGLTIQPSADDLHVYGGSAQSFYLWGAKRAVIDGTVFDGKGVTDDAKLWGSGGKLPSLTLRNCVMRNFSHDSDPSSHNQALYIGSSESVVVENCRFDDNGNTAHLFVSSFGVNSAVPGYVCIRGNTFGNTHGAYYSVNVHPSEIPTSARVYVEPGQSTVKPLVTNAAFARPCS